MKKKLFLFIFFCFAISFAQKEHPAGVKSEESPSAEITTKETDGKITGILKESAAEKTHADDKTETKSDDIAQEDEITDTAASLTILTTPPSATILLNRKKSGLTPFIAAQLEPQEINIMLLKDGYELFDTTVNLQAGQKDTILINLVSENQKGEAVEAKSAVSSKTQKTTNAKEKTFSDAKETSAEITEEKKKKMDRIGIIVFLSVMLVLIGMQEAG